MSRQRSLLRFLLLAVFAAGGVGTADAAPKPSFSCAAASAPDERTICANPSLIALDVVANDGYLFLRDKLGKAKANKINLPLIKKRQSCGPDAACIRAAQLESISTFKKFGANIDAPPDRKAVAEKPPTTNVETPSAPAVETPAPVPAPRPQPAKPQPAAKAIAPDAAPAASASTGEVAVAAPPSETPSAVETPAPEAAAPSEERQTVAEAAAPPSEDATDEPPREIDGESVVPSSPAESRGVDDTANAGDAEAVAPTETSPSTPPVVEKEVVETFRKKHLFAFILAGAVFAFLAFYLIRKLRGEHGVQPTPVATPEPAPQPSSGIAPSQSASAARPTPTALRPEIPPTRMNPGELRAKLTPPEPLGKVDPTGSGKQKDDGSLAWVWSKYKGKV